MSVASLDFVKRQEIEEYFADRTGSGKVQQLPFCDNSGEMPCFYWKKDTRIVSREHDGTGFTWKVYCGPDFLVKVVTKKTIQVSSAAFEKLSVPIFFPDPKGLQIEEIRCSKKSSSIQFTVEDKPDEISREEDFFDFILKVASKKGKRIAEYIKTRMEKIQTEAPLTYYRLKKFFKESGLELDSGLRNFGEQCSNKALFPPPRSPLSDLKEGETIIQSWDKDGETWSLIKSEEGPGFFAVKHDGQWEVVTQVWVLSPIGALLGEKSMKDITLNYACLQPLEFERSADGCRAFFYLDVPTSMFDPTQIIYPSERGVVAVRFPQGYFLYVENPSFNKEAGQERFSVLPIPLFSPKPEFMDVDRYDPTQQSTSFQKCSPDQVEEICGEDDIGSLYSKCLGVLGKKNGAPLVFVTQGSSPQSTSSTNVEVQKKPLVQLLNRTYCWHSNNGDLVFFEYKDGKPIWTIYDAAHNIHTPETVDFSDEKFVFPQKKHYVPVLDPLRLVSISSDKKKIVFRIEEQKSSVDGETLVSPTQWNLTVIVDGSAGEVCGKQINLHTRVYLQTPASSSVIEIHLTTHGLLAREIPKAEVEKRKREKKITRRGHVVAISASSSFILSILQDFDRKIQLGIDFENCSKYAVEIFRYAGRPFAENHLNPWDSPRNPLAFTASSSSAEISQAHEMQETRKLASCSQGNTTLAVYEKQNGPNFFYTVYATKDKKTNCLFKEGSGFRHTVSSLKADGAGFHLVLRRTGIFSFISMTKTFKLD